MSSVNVLLVTLMFWAGCAWAESTECSNDPTKTFKFSVISLRNKTGHWTTQVALNHTAAHGEMGHGPWNLDVEQTSSLCNGEETVHTKAIVTAPPKRAEPGYELVPGLGYYKLHTDAKDWHEASEVCNSEGAHLVVINSEEEATASVGIWNLRPNIVEGFLNEYLYVGFHDVYKEGEYLTVFATRQEDAGYLKWAPNEPSGESEDCGTLMRTGKMNDISCNVKLGFLCEQELQ